MERGLRVRPAAARGLAEGWEDERGEGVAGGEENGARATGRRTVLPHNVLFKHRQAACSRSASSCRVLF